MDKELELTLAINKINKLGRRTDINISMQSFLIILGLFTILSPEKLNDFDFIFKYNIDLASIIIPILLMYFFIQFGYMLYSYHSLRKTIDSQANKIYNEEIDVQRLYSIFGDNRMIEMIYLKLKLDDSDIVKDKDIPNFKFNVFHMWTYVLMIIFCLNHAVVFSFIINNWNQLGMFVSIILTGISILILIGSYRDYIILSKNKIFFKLTVFNLVFTILLISTYLLMIFLDKI